ncbi:hypothetical protein H0H92_011066 [Tricholoma furcatifolium]|nr:hypothetical protein H0H92_011066 [Tricholoma furcatifolium]
MSQSTPDADWHASDTKVWFSDMRRRVPHLHNSILSLSREGLMPAYTTTLSSATSGLVVHIYIHGYLYAAHILTATPHRCYVLAIPSNRSRSYHHTPTRLAQFQADGIPRACVGKGGRPQGCGSWSLSTLKPTAAGLGREAEQEAAVFAQAVDIEELSQMLRPLDLAKDDMTDTRRFRRCIAAVSPQPQPSAYTTFPTPASAPVLLRQGHG